MLLRQGSAPYETYFFKHALVRDAAYSTLLREQRRALHGRIAETLESQFTEVSEKQPPSNRPSATVAAIPAAALRGRRVGLVMRYAIPISRLHSLAS